MIKSLIIYRRVPVFLVIWLIIAQAFAAEAAAQSAVVNQSLDGRDSVEVTEIVNYKLSDFKWDQPKDGDYMLGTFQGSEVFTGEAAKLYPGLIQVRVRFRNARMVSAYMTHRGKRISQPVSRSDQRILLKRPEWNRLECVPRRQVFTIKRRIRNRVRVCQVVMIVPKNCPARVASKICFTPRTTRRR
ncbi:MAG TPA: hypothetical protein VNO14_12580 [Blastocatellia bacterium]|nr:hypothetical protein [Blastocatellia bacterium]